MRCFISSLLPDLQMSPPGSGTPPTGAAMDDKGDSHDTITLCTKAVVGPEHATIFKDGGSLQCDARSHLHHPLVTL